MTAWWMAQLRVVDSVGGTLAPGVYPNGFLGLGEVDGRSNILASFLSLQARAVRVRDYCLSRLLR